MQIAYYDQQREQLDPERTVFDTVGEGNDTVTVERPHAPRARLPARFPVLRRSARDSPVKALSGGERNRLLLARLFTRPANVLVLDEPTNDLDLETLELLEAQLVEWPGTLLLVSHDRAFLDNVVTSTLVFEGDGRVQEYVGGYDDWVRQRDTTQRDPLRRDSAARVQRPEAGAPARAASSETLQPVPSVAAALPAPAGRSCRTRNSASSMNGRPESRRSRSSRERSPRAIASADFYKEGAEAIAAVLARVESIQREVTAAYARWNDLESRCSRLSRQD